MSRASDLFSKIEERGIDFIDEMILNQDPEELVIDYKCVSTPDGNGKMLSDDKKNFGKAVSGFANSDGGIVIWGVDCRRVQGQGDVPTGYQADVTSRMKGFSPKWWKSLLESLTSGVTAPAHQRVRHLTLVRQSKSDGVVVTFIPAGMNVPYRCLVDGKDNYYIRAGAEFMAAPHAVLAGLFGRVPQPIIELALDMLPKKWKVNHPTDNPALWFDLNIMIKNIGRGMAEDLFVLVDVGKTSLICREYPFFRSDWDLTVGGGIWDGPTMAVSKPLANRLPPGGVVKFTLGLFGGRQPCEFEAEITVGARGGPGDSKRIHVTREKMEQISEIYNKTPASERTRAHVWDAMVTKLSQES